MNSMPSADLNQAILQLQRVKNFLDLPQTPPHVLEKVKTVLRLSREITLDVHRPGPELPTKGAIHESLAAALVSFARKQRSARVSPKDLKAVVEDYAAEELVPFWKATYAPTIGGLLRFEPEVMKLLERSGVRVFEYEGDAKAEWRIVDTRWRTSSADIHEWVLGTKWQGGDRCRFCNMLENPNVNSLLAVQPERRNGLTMIGDVVVRQTGSVLTHDRCRPFWINWAATAAQHEASLRPAPGELQ